MWEDENGKKPKSKKWLLLFIVFLMVAAVGFIILVLQKENRRKEEAIYRDLTEANEVTEEEMASGTGPKINMLEELGVSIPEKNLDWDSLHEQNPDIYAWIYIPNTSVDYPILQHPSDNNYYLNYNIDGTKGYPGCIYTENYNHKDFSDCNTVVYGHNLKDGTMFTSLHNFEDEEIMKENHYIFIYTEEVVLVYQIFAAYEYNAIHLLLNYDLDNPYEYEQYLKDVYNVELTNTRVANIRHNISVTKEDRIITLSTCTTDGRDEFRFLVQGVLLNP